MRYQRLVIKSEAVNCNDRRSGCNGVIFCGLSAIYFAMAQALNAEYGRVILPVGIAPRDYEVLNVTA